MAPQQIVTRFAPSPTGLFHAGNYRTAVFAYLFARHHQGTFIVRIENTDKARSKKEYEENILETLHWLGLEYDFMHRQSEWAGEHEFILRSLVESGKAYVSKEKNEAGEERELIRFRNPGKTVTFTDLIRGNISIDTADLGDFIIAKSFTEPVFHFAVVADDALTGVNRIIRGDDHISNTPRQILIYEALGANPPQYAHLPLVLASDRSKLSKRKGARPVSEYRELGFLPQAMLNYIAMLGWHPGTDEEIFTKEELIERFSLDQVQKSGAMFDEVKLRWFNREHMKSIEQSAFGSEAKKFMSPALFAKLEETGRFEKLLPELRERIETYGDIRELEANGELDYIAVAPEYDGGKLIWKQDSDPQTPHTHLMMVVKLVQAIADESWSKESVKEAVWNYAEKEGKGSVLWPMRYALTGREKSPDPFEVAGILGKNETLARLETALQKLTRA